MFFLAIAAILLHGYHPWAEDAEIYLPGVLKILNPQLLPHDRPFFESHAQLTLYPNLIAGFVRLTHLSLPWALFLGQFISVFMFLWACWKLSGVIFQDLWDRRAGVALVAALLTLPVAGTALYIMDQYLNPRNIAAFAAVFAIVAAVEKKYVRTVLWLIFGAAVHPLMAVFACSYCALLPILRTVRVRHEKVKPAVASMAAALPFINEFHAPSGAYRAAVSFHAFHYVTRWAWYEVLGAIAPVFIFWAFARVASTRKMCALELMSRGFMIYGVIYLLMAVVVAIPARLQTIARIQPLRSLHLEYVMLLLVAGGFAGEFLLKNRVWRWLALFLPICAGMFVAQEQLFAASGHLELPGFSPRNDYERAFLWVRENTPQDAFFALDPDLLNLPGEDSQGFRAIAQRSRLADYHKDSGAVSMFPPLAETWYAQTQALKNWSQFGNTDFAQLQARYGVNWVVVQRSQRGDLHCPYQNRTVSVCEIE